MLKICFPSRREAQKRGSSNPQIHQNSMKNRWKKLEVFQIALGIDFLLILDGFLLEVGRQNRVKIDIRWCCKNDEKLMMTWMAKKLDIGGYDPIWNLDFGAQGGGGRRAKSLLQGKLGREGMEGIVEMDSSSYPKPPVAQRVGGITKGPPKGTQGTK